MCIVAKTSPLHHRAHYHISTATATHTDASSLSQGQFFVLLALWFSSQDSGIAFSMNKHDIATNAHAAAFTVQRRCVLQHHALLLQTIGLYSNNVETLLLFIAGTTASFDRAYSPIRPSSGLTDRKAHHCDVRMEPVHVPMSHHAYTLGIHLRHSATVESKVSAHERSRRDRKRCIRFPR